METTTPRPPRFEYQGNKIRERRKELGMSGKDVADQLNVSQATISKYERGVTQVPPHLRDRLCDAIDTTWDWISLGQAPDEDEEEPRTTTALVVGGIPGRMSASTFAFEAGRMLGMIDRLVFVYESQPDIMDSLDPAYRRRIEDILGALHD